MEIVRGGDDLGTLDFEGANSKLEELEPLGCGFGLEVGSSGGVDGQDTSPGRGRYARFLRGDCDEVGVGDSVLEFSDGRREVSLRHLLHCTCT